MKMKKSHLGITSHRKGVSFEQEYGFDKAHKIRQKISKALIGREIKASTIKKLKNKVPWNKGKTGLQDAWNKNVKTSTKVKTKIKLSMLKKYQQDPTLKTKISIATKKAMQRPTVKKNLLLRATQHFPYSNTSIEIKLQHYLTQHNIIFHTQQSLIGRPDIFIKPNICIFADGDYWHNRSESIIRDKYVNKELKKQGYKILRFWEHDINNNIDKCLKIIQKAL